MPATSHLPVLDDGVRRWILDAARLKSVSLSPHARDVLLPEHSNMEYAPRSADTAFNALLASGSVASRPGPGAGRGRETTGAYPVGCPVPIASVINNMARDTESAHAITYVGDCGGVARASGRSTFNDAFEAMTAGLTMHVVFCRQLLNAHNTSGRVHSICAGPCTRVRPRQFSRVVQTDAGRSFAYFPSSRCAGDARPWTSNVRGTCVAWSPLFLLVNMSGSGPSTAEAAGHLHGVAETTPRAKYMAPMCAALGMLSHGIFNSMRKRPAMYREFCASRAAHRRGAAIRRFLHQPVFPLPLRRRFGLCE